MKIDKIKERLKDLTPQQKLNILEPLFEKEKDKKSKKEIQFLIKRTEEEKLVLEEEISKLGKKPKKEEKEEPLENIVEETLEENPDLKRKTKDLQKLYSLEEKKPDNLYAVGDIKYLSSNGAKEQEYKAEPEGLNVDRFQEVHMSETKKLEKARKKYESGAA
ncbi:MAG: hypothetical protein ABIB47_05430 [Candidatus Woesearchaeota archaeon]